MDIKIKDNNKLRFSTFTQLEYIESTGTQYINTELSLEEFKISVDVDVCNTSNDTQIAGFKQSSLGFYNKKAQLYLYNTNIQCSTACQTGVKYNICGEFIKGSYKLYVDDTLIGTSTISPALSVKNILIFARNSSSGIAELMSSIKIYKVIIKNTNNVILAEFIPSLDFNNVPCMYDTISKTFFYNQGSGDFIAGPIVKQGFPETILLKTTTLYHKNTPNVDGLQLLNGILNAQEAAEDVVLNRIRVDIGNVSGSLSELLQYAGMAGFNDNYEPQTKPRLVGTWTINDWYTTAQLAQAQAAFDGLTIVGDPNYVIDFSQMAVQVLDPNEDNYNPAVAIILQGQNLGTTTTDAPLGHGRWFLTKNDAANVTKFGTDTRGIWFAKKTSLTDTNNIVSDSTDTYDFTEFNEFKYFTSITSLGAWNNDANYGFCQCTKLVSIELPENITIHQMFYYCTSLKRVVFPNSFSLEANRCFTGSGIESIDLSNMHNTTIPDLCFHQCFLLKNIIIPQTITQIGVNSFTDVGRDASFLNDDVFDLNLPNLTSIGYRAFSNCKTLTSISNLGNITSIPNNEVFYSCDRLKEFVLPNTITTLGDSGFCESTNLKQLQLQSSITSIGSSCFYSTGSNASIINFIDVYLPNLASIGGAAFQYCYLVKKVTNLGSITSLGRRTFANMPNIEFIEIPQTVSSIGEQCFIDINGNCIIHLLPITPPAFVNFSIYVMPAQIKLYVGDGTSAASDNAILADYLADSRWATFSSQLDTWYNYLHPTT